MASSPSKAKMRKVRTNQRKQTKFKPKGPNKNSSKAALTTQKPLKVTNERLTLSDWLLVFSVKDEHPEWEQGQVVKYFAHRKEGVLKFSQSALPKKLAKREELKARAKSFPNALSSKRERVVTCPDVDRALFLWQQRMEGKNESVSADMLCEKCAKFEQLFEVPGAERLSGRGWLISWQKAYVLLPLHAL
jgi:hypothetical protein